MAKYKILSEKTYIGAGVINTADGPVEVGGVYELSDETVSLLESLVRLELYVDNKGEQSVTLPPLNDGQTTEIYDSAGEDKPIKKTNAKS